MTDNGQRNSVVRTGNLAYAALTGTAFDTTFIEEGTGISYLYKPTVSSPNNGVECVINLIASGTAGTQFAGVRSKQLRTGHVQEWQTGLGITGFASWAVFDATYTLVPLEIKENNGGIVFAATAPVSMGALTSKELICNTTTVGGYPFIAELNGAAIAFFQSYSVSNNVFGMGNGANQHTVLQVFGAQCRWGPNADVTHDITGAATFESQASFVVPPKLPTYTVAGLPAAGTAGRMAFATNARNTAQTAGNGTGQIVVDNGTIWVCMSTGVAVVA